MPPTKNMWFLPPDFTFHENGLLQLGTVIPDPKHPTLVLLDPETETTTPPITLPPVQVLIEQNHNHIDNQSHSVGGEFWARFVGVASASAKLNLEWRTEIQCGTVDHEVRTFARALSGDTLAAIVAQPSVRKHMDSGLFGKRMVYIVSGIRIARTGMSVTMGRGTTRGGGGGVSGPAPAGAMPVEVGVDLHGEKRKDRVHSYETAPGIVFAYRLSVIRQRRDGGVESEIFSHRTAFMAGGIEDEVPQMEAAEVDLLDLEDEGLDFTWHEVGREDVCVSFV